MQILRFCWIALLLPSTSAMDRAHFVELNQKAAELRQQKDWAGLLKVMRQIGDELPGPTPRFLLRMASVEMHLGHYAEAIRWMQQYASMGLTYDVAADDDLAPLAREESYKAIAAKLHDNARPIRKAELVCHLPVRDLMPEDLASDLDPQTAQQRFIVSSIRHHSLFRVSLPLSGSDECTISELAVPKEAKRWPTLAVSSDRSRKLIWATASAMPGFGGFPKEDSGKAELLAIDEASGRVLNHFDLPTDSAGVFGDMFVAHDGTVYVSDSIGGGVYRLRGDLAASKFERIADGLFSPQTPALAHDGKRLFVADYPMGIAVVHLDSARSAREVELEYLRHPADVAVTGLDGLFLYKDTLIGIQNGTEPARIVRFRLNHAQNEILSAEVIEQSTDRLGEPTHVIEVNGWFYVIANVGWDKVDDAGQLKTGQQFTRPVLLRFKNN